MTLDLETSSIMQNHILFIINACHNLWSRNLPHPLSSEQASVIQSSAEETKTAPNGRVPILVIALSRILFVEVIYKFAVYDLRF